MAGRTFSYDSGKQKKLARENSGGTGNDFHKIQAIKTFWSIMPAITPEGEDERPVIKVVYKYEAWDRSNGQNKKIGSTGTTAKGETDYIRNVTKKIKDMIKEAESAEEGSAELSAKQVKILRSVTSNFGVKVEHYVNAIDAKNTKDGVKALKLPRDASDYLFSKIDEADDVNELFHPENGKILKIEHNGKEKTERRYKTVEFLEGKKIGLLSKGNLTEEELATQCVDLETLQPAYNESEYNKIKAALNAALKKFKIELPDIESDEIVYADEDNLDVSAPSTDDDFDATTDSSDDFEEEAPAAKVPPKAATKTTTKTAAKVTKPAAKVPPKAATKPATKAKPAPKPDPVDDFEETETTVSDDFEDTSIDESDISISDDDFEDA